MANVACICISHLLHLKCYPLLTGNANRVGKQAPILPALYNLKLNFDPRLAKSAACDAQYCGSELLWSF